MDITELRRTQEEALTRQKLESLGLLAGGINNCEAAFSGQASPREYAASADGQRFLINTVVAGETPITVMVNWAARLKRRAPIVCGRSKSCTTRHGSGRQRSARSCYRKPTLNCIAVDLTTVCDRACRAGPAEFSNGRFGQDAWDLPDFVGSYKKGTTPANCP